MSSELEQQSLALIEFARGIVKEKNVTPKEITSALGRAIDELLGENNDNTETISSQYGEKKHLDYRVWKTFRFDESDAEAWIEANVPLAEAVRWRDIPPSEYANWKATGCSPPVCSRWHKKHFLAEEMQICVENNISTDEAKYLKTFGDLKIIVTTMADHHMNRKDILKWYRYGVPVEQISGWVTRGYPPGKASKFIQQNKKPEDVKDMRQGAPVMGSAWKKIADHADRGGWTIHPPKPQINYSRNTTILVCEMEKNDKRLYVHFTRSGQFLKILRTKNVAARGERKLQGALRIISENNT